jgi:hypothetical protein
MMGGGRGILIPISTLAIDGTGAAIANTSNSVPKNNFFICYLL